MISIIDYSAGNIRNVVRALDFLKVENEVTADPEKVKQADAVIVPGVGAAGSAIRSLKRSGLFEVLRERLRGNQPFLGICLGLQILFDKSEEDDTECFGFFSGIVKKFSAPDIKIPHIGWNPVDFVETSKILKGIQSGTPFYFVHSYVGDSEDKDIVVATTSHGETFSAVVNQGNIWGVQFHPEKSGKVGLAVLKNFTDMVQVS